MLSEVQTVLGEVLDLEAQSRQWTAATRLLGDLPELDSMAVVNVITALEERFSIHIADDEISAAEFETLGSLADFIEQKVRAG